MLEIGGYMEFPKFTGSMLHCDAIALNSARNSLAYLIEAKKISKITVPRFLCASVEQICRRYNVQIHYYFIGKNFLPLNLQETENDEWIYLVNYYGQIDNSMIMNIKKQHKRLIVDNVQAYFQEAVNNVDTIYTCRKFFGVPDGAFLYTNEQISRLLQQDRSSERMVHLLGRYENSAKEYYSAYLANEGIFEQLPLRKMSKLTNNLLHGIDYTNVKDIRENNYMYLHQKFSAVNKLSLIVPDGPFMYPLYIPNGSKIRKKLQNKGIYISTLWSDVFNICNESELEYDMAKNILPLPCDQRYSIKEMEYLAQKICEYIN